MVSTTNQAQIKWAEREDKVWVTVNHPSPTDVKTDLTATSLKVSFTARDQPYAFEFEFNKEIKVDDTKQSDLSKARLLEFCFFKAEDGDWGKIAKCKAPWIQVDWDKWADSDAEDEAPGAGGAGDFDMSQMMGMGGKGGGKGMPDMGGMGGMGDMMGGMGGMPGMGGEGGAGGMDMAAMMQMMGKGGKGDGKGGMPDFSGLDMDALKGMMGGEGGDEAGGDSDDDLPDLEEDAEKVD